MNAVLQRTAIAEAPRILIYPFPTASASYAQLVCGIPTRPFALYGWAGAMLLLPASPIANTMVSDAGVHLALTERAYEQLL